MLPRYQIEIKYGLIALVLFAGLVVLNQTHAFSGLDSILKDFFNLLAGFGFIGFFMIAMIANASLLVHLPYTMPLLSLALSGANFDQMVLMGLASGIGAGFGEFITYAVAQKMLGENPALERSSLFQWVKRTVNSHPRTAPLLVLVWAVLPLPDDTVIIPLAIVGYGLKRISLPLFAGKIINNISAAASFYYFTAWSADRIPTSIQTDVALGSLIVFVLMILYQTEKNYVMKSLLVTEYAQ